MLTPFAKMQIRPGSMSQSVFEIEVRSNFESTISTLVASQDSMIEDSLLAAVFNTATLKTRVNQSFQLIIRNSASPSSYLMLCEY